MISCSVWSFGQLPPETYSSLKTHYTWHSYFYVMENLPFETYNLHYICVRCDSCYFKAKPITRSYLQVWNRELFLHIIANSTHSWYFLFPYFENIYTETHKINMHLRAAGFVPYRLWYIFIRDVKRKKGSCPWCHSGLIKSACPSLEKQDQICLEL